MKNKSADGLRGLAAFHVSISHFLSAFLPMTLHKIYPWIFPENANPDLLFGIVTSPFFSIFYNGHFAVMIFFVLSGYVLTLPYYTAEEKSKSILKKRLLGRYLRLNTPIAAAVLLSFCFYKLGAYSNVQAGEGSGSANWFSNYFPGGLSLMTAIKEASYESLFFGKGTFIPPLWTLKIEFFGSLYVLLFYILKPKNKSSILFLSVLGLIYGVYRQDFIYYYAIFFGSLLYRFRNLKFRFALFALGFYFGGFQFKTSIYDHLPSPIFFGTEICEKRNLYSAIGAVLLTLSIVNGFGSKLFESRPAQFLGRISFSIYLLHFIVLCSISSFIFNRTPSTGIFLAINFVSYVLLCFSASSLFERLVDRGSIHVSHKFSSKIPI